MSASLPSETISAACLLGEWARLLLTTLVQSGISDLWLSPGSRSTPFAWAAAHTPGLAVRAIVDERAAAFLALGHARVTGRPSALLCTSGSAADNYFPAVVEASLAHLPLVVLTADRPLDVQHAAAAQTIDQLKLYGDHVRRFYDLGSPDASSAALTGARRAVAQAVAESRGPRPGPVHVNLRARKPLEPAAPANEAERALAARVTQLLERPLARHAPAQILANEAVRAAARTVLSSGSSAIVVGPLPAYGESLAEPIAELARLTAAPIFAEAASQVRFALGDEALSAPLFDWLLSAPGAAQRHRPDLLVCIGATPTSSALERWAASVPRRIVLAEQGFPDALGDAELVACGDLRAALAELVGEIERGCRGQGQREGGEWVGGVRRAGAKCGERVAEALAAPSRELSEGLAVKTVVENLPDGAVLALGNSLPIRDVDAYVTRAARVRVVVQRGANGIDGLVSGAIGSAIGSGAPTLLLLGDVSLLHDLSGLANARLATSPLVIAVVDNAGGRIFDQLPVAKLYADQPEAALWNTPPACDFAHAAALFGLGYQAPTTPEAVATSTRAALERRGATLLHLRVGPHSAEQMRQSVLTALAGDLAGFGA
jgi:2-succinyl-5-enolpyruvyl-6-hydroxy-3-cyclohexene-1-carboxylate synthase